MIIVGYGKHTRPSGQKPAFRGFGGCLAKLSPRLAHGGNAGNLLSHGADVVVKKSKNINNTFFSIFSDPFTMGGAMRDTASAQGV